MRSGQKHQRREKQAAHLDAAQELSHDAASAIIDEDDMARPEAAAAAAPAEQAAAEDAAPPAAAEGAELQSAAAAEELVADAPEEQREDALREDAVPRELEASAGKPGEVAAAEREQEDAQGAAEDADAQEEGSEGTGPMVTVQRARPASVTADEEVRHGVRMCMLPQCPARVAPVRALLQQPLHGQGACGSQGARAEVRGQSSSQRER